MNRPDLRDRARDLLQRATAVGRSTPDPTPQGSAELTSRAILDAALARADEIIEDAQTSAARIVAEAHSKAAEVGKQPKRGFERLWREDQASDDETLAAFFAPSADLASDSLDWSVRSS